MSRMYLRATSSGLGAYGAFTKKSSALPVGSQLFGAGGDPWNMLVTKGSSQDTGKAGMSFSPVTSDQDMFVSRWIGDQILVPQVDANDWTFAGAFSESNAASNQFACLSIYVLKNDDTVRGFIYDSHASLGTEFATSETGRVYTVSGAAVSGCVSTDRIAVEVWVHSQSSMTTVYQTSFWFDGTTDPVNGTATSNAASYLETPQDLFTAPPKAIIFPAGIRDPRRNSLLRR